MRSAPLMALLAATLSLAGCGTPGSEDHDYAKWNGIEVRSLPADKVAALEQGAGAGYARAAENNGYPGPRHVLELSGKLELSQDQEIRVQELRDRTEVAAKNVGSQLLEAYIDLEQLYRDASVTPESLQLASERVGTLEGQLMAVHLAAHIEARGMLTAEQNAEYQRLRGHVHED